MPQLGEDIPIEVQLGLEETNKYVRAEVRNAAGTAISGSPFALTHAAGGLYKKTGVAMPSGTTHVSVRFLVYDNDDYSTRTAGYEPEVEIFELIPSPAGSIYAVSELDIEIDSDEIDL
jgi:hypothetical protein